MRAAPILLVSVLIGAIAHGDLISSAVAQLTPDEIIADARIDVLKDEPYFHLVRADPLRGETYLELRKWDMVFTGPLPGFGSNINNIIPGRYDHSLAYVGKDSSGYAYFVELNVNSLTDLEGIRIFSPGTDFGDVKHSSGARFWSDFPTEYRWAKTFHEDVRAQLLANDVQLTKRVITDLRNHLPYQMPASLGDISLGSRTILLADDGLDRGAGCTDYWTILFEEYAGTCFYGVRFSAEDFIDYVLNDPAGQLAYIPDEVNPLPWRLSGRELLRLGFTVQEDAPHAFLCGGEPESGLVLADLLIDNPMLADPPEAQAPADPAHLSQVVEYYHPGLDRFLLTNLTEAEQIDRGDAGPGWTRTGVSFKAWTHPRGDAIGVTRFYAKGPRSHFLTIDTEERDTLLSLNPLNGNAPDVWIIEGITFYMHPLSEGRCLDGTAEIIRLFNGNSTRPAHRYTPDRTIANKMTDDGWINEGTAMCAPL